MDTIIMFVVLVVMVFAAIIIKKDTRSLIRRSDELQKSLNVYMEREHKRK